MSEPNIVEYSTTCKGHIALLHNGYKYRVRKRKMDSSVIWECLENSRNGCMGKVAMKTETLQLLVQHSCKKNIAKVELHKVVSMCKKRAAEDITTSVQLIYEQEFSKLKKISPNMEIPSFRRFKSILYRARSQAQSSKNIKPSVAQTPGAHSPQPVLGIPSVALQSITNQVSITTRPNINIPPAEQTSYHEELCLQWNSYNNNMLTVFPSLLTSQKFFDVTISCEGKSFKCHKVLLAMCSDIFAGLLSKNPSKHPIIVMKGIKFWEMQSLLEFMYRGEVNVSQTNLPALLQAAQALEIKSFVNASISVSSFSNQYEPICGGPQPPVTKEISTNSANVATSIAQLRSLHKKRSLTMDVKKKAGHIVNSVTSMEDSGHSLLNNNSPQLSKTPQVGTIQLANERNLISPDTFDHEVIIQSEPLDFMDTTCETSQAFQNSASDEFAYNIKQSETDVSKMTECFEDPQIVLWKMFNS